MSKQQKHNDEMFVLAEMSKPLTDGVARMQSYIPLDKAERQWDRRDNGATLRLKDLETGEWTEGWRQDYEPKKDTAEPYSMVLGRSRNYLKTRVASDI